MSNLVYHNRAMLAVAFALVVSACAGPAPAERTSPAPPATTTEETTPMTTPPPPDSAATARLTSAVAGDDLAGVQQAIAEGADLETRDQDGRTPLVVATKANRAGIARALLDAGADPNAKDNLQDSAYLYAGAEGLNDILALTLDHGADVTSTNRYGGTALIPASEHGHVETVRILIAAGVPVNHVNNLGWTALLEAIVLGDGSQNHVTVVGLLLDAGADPAIADRDGALPRQLAADAGYDAIVAEIDRSVR